MRDPPKCQPLFVALFPLSPPESTKRGPNFWRPSPLYLCYTAVSYTHLCVGRKVDDVIELLRGTQCRNGTSCPDQLSYALEETKELVGA